MRQSKYSQEFKNSTVELIINNNESVVYNTPRNLNKFF